MNRLPSSASFQGVLDSIIRNYLLNELPPCGAENGNARTLVAEKDLGLLQENGLHIHSPREGQPGNEVNNNVGPIPGTSANANNGASTAIDHEYVKAIYKCFEKRGVFKELQTFLRHKLVSILQDEWPNLQKPVAPTQNEGPNTVVSKLVDDFLRCHKLLYTLSVLASESDVKPQSTRVLYGKLSAKEAEDLLDEMGIKRNSRLSSQILKCYFDKENFSLLESIHYLGVWLDESSGLFEEKMDAAEDNARHDKRKGSGGESIVLSKRGKEKAEESRPVCLCRQNRVNGMGAVGIEKRLLELEKNLEREKDFKIKEAIEKYKKEEYVKLREELETKFKLELIEKEREHFLDLQRKMEAINTERQQEKEQWLEVKIGLEKDLCQVKKQLIDTINASGDSRWVGSKPQTSVGESPRPRQVNKTCQVSLDETPPVAQKCSYGNCSCHSRVSTTFSGYRHHQTMDPIEQDRLAFLQYRMEQQDEEIKTLRRQLLLSSSSQLVQTTPKSKKSPRVDERKVHISPRVVTSGESHKHHSSNDTSTSADDLETFLTNTRARVEKLDTAVDKVDEIVQEIFAKRRSPLSKELSSRLLLSAAAGNKSKPSLVQLYSSLHTMSSAPMLSSMNTPSANVPLVHQQLPEKPNAYSPRTMQQANTSPDTVYPPNTNLLSASAIPVPNIRLYQSPPSVAKFLWPSTEISRISSAVDLETQARPETPVERIFPVAYSGHSSSKQVDRKGKESGESSKEPSPQTTREKRPKEPDRPSTNNSTPIAVVGNIDEPEESLFHMAMRNSPPENQREEESLEEKAIRNGALSREKLLSSDEGENSISQSVSLSVSKKVSVQPVLKPVLGNGISKKETTKAITKSKVSVDETFDKRDQISMKATTSNGSKSERRQSWSTAVQREKTKSHNVSSSSSSGGGSSRKSKAISLSRQSQQQAQNAEDDEQSSLNISVARSMDGEDNNEDFWQL